MFFVGVVYLIQMIGLGIGPELSGLMEVMPLIGGILVTLVGFGFLTGDRRRVKKERKKRAKRQKQQAFKFEEEEPEDVGLGNDLNDRTRGRRKAKFKDLNIDPYAFRQNKKLYKSRTDRKWAGVCGGLARYFGVSSTVIRLLFVITFFAGSGASLLGYIVLAIVLDKEPREMADDFEY